MNPRITSIDALRGLVMFIMIFVNDLASAGAIVPNWMMHYELRHPDANGMTFVDLVLPAFLFIVGMSIPFALGSRLDKGERTWKTILHVLQRTASLLFIGVLMVNGEPDAAKLGWSPALWQVLMFGSAILAFGSLKWMRLIGLMALLWLSYIWVNAQGEKILMLSPFHLRSQWWGILGLIGWDYLVGATVFLLFKGNRTALLGSMVLLLGLFAADHAGVFDGCWLTKVVGIGDTLGAQGAITVGGVLLASILRAPELGGTVARVRFALLFIGAAAAGALLLHAAYGINKNAATPSYALWGCAVTSALWLALYLITDVRRIAAIGKPLSIAGQNVLLAFFLSEAMPFLLEVLHLEKWYHALSQINLSFAILRSTACGIAVLGVTAGLNRLGFRLRF
jgi:heparan-alpha-glucosaminide N-acetyltransferase